MSQLYSLILGMLVIRMAIGNDGLPAPQGAISLEDKAIHSDCLSVSATVPACDESLLQTNFANTDGAVGAWLAVLNEAANMTESNSVSGAAAAPVDSGHASRPHERPSRAAGGKQGVIDPIFYLHVPKSGSSFATTVAHHACGQAIPRNTTVKEPDDFFKQYANCSNASFGRFESGHNALPPGQPLQNVAFMMRDPLQRILSGFFAEEPLHDCVDIQLKYHCSSVKCDGDTGTPGEWVRNTSVIHPAEYARCVENCTANMLSGRFCASNQPVDAEMLLPMIEDIGFIGITEHWSLSVCLWHAKFGGQMLPAELVNVRPGVMFSELGYDPEMYFATWRPHVDYLLYYAAFSRFWKEISHYGITTVSCERQMALEG